jgi:murein DD-endopeptidase MepM/ murein hydrolase activator NlpD
MRLRALIAGAVLPLVLWACLPLVSEGAGSSGGSARAASLQQKIQATQGKIGRKNGTEKVLSSDIARYSHKIGVLQNRIGSLQSREARIQADLDAKRSRLAATQAGLRKQRARSVHLRARLAEARTLLARRRVELYEADKPDLMTVLLNSKGFADLLERSDFYKRISDSDKVIVRAVRVGKADALASAKRLAKLETAQHRLTTAVLARRNEIASVKQSLIDTRVGYAGTKSDKVSALRKVHGERQHLEGALSELKAEQAKITGVLQGTAGTLPAGAIKPGSGALIWPVNGPITSPFCEPRPWEACHPGIDIGVPSGTPIRAAAAGRVVLMQSEAQSGGYGNFTCIQHTGTMSTCYAHQSRFATSMGASVKQGQVIGISGCTGRCYGPHLHFEVRINGSVTNPMNYL